MNIINTKEDVTALSEAERNQFMTSLRGTLWRLSKDDDLKTWVAAEDNTNIQRFGFTRDNFPDAVAPALPIYIDTSPTYQELRASAYPPAADYLDAIVKGDTAQAQAYIDECLAVKAKYPK